MTQPAQDTFRLGGAGGAPSRALADATLPTPAPVQIAPLPVPTMAGGLSHTQAVLQARNLFGGTA